MKKIQRTQGFIACTKSVQKEIKSESNYASTKEILLIFISLLLSGNRTPTFCVQFHPVKIITFILLLEFHFIQFSSEILAPDFKQYSPKKKTIELKPNFFTKTHQSPQSNLTRVILFFFYNKHISISQKLESIMLCSVVYSSC